MNLTVIPAYGRDYTSAKAVRADWNANKDFIIRTFLHPDDGRAVNKADLRNLHISATVSARYSSLEKICIVQS